MKPIDWLRLGAEQYVREMSDDEFAQFVQRARPPAEQREAPETDTAALIRQVLGDHDD